MSTISVPATPTPPSVCWSKVNCISKIHSFQHTAIHGRQGTLENVRLPGSWQLSPPFSRFFFTRGESFQQKILSIARVEGRKTCRHGDATSASRPSQEGWQVGEWRPPTLTVIGSAAASLFQAVSDGRSRRTVRRSFSFCTRHTLTTHTDRASLFLIKSERTAAHKKEQEMEERLDATADVSRAGRRKMLFPNLIMASMTLFLSLFSHGHWQHTGTNSITSRKRRRRRHKKEAAKKEADRHFVPGRQSVSEVVCGCTRDRSGSRKRRLSRPRLAIKQTATPHKLERSFGL